MVSQPLSYLESQHDLLPAWLMLNNAIIMTGQNINFLLYQLFFEILANTYFSQKYSLFSVLHFEFILSNNNFKNTRNPENQESTHVDTVRACIIHTERPFVLKKFETGYCYSKASTLLFKKEEFWLSQKEIYMWRITRHI